MKKIFMSAGILFSLLMTTGYSNPEATVSNSVEPDTEVELEVNDGWIIDEANVKYYLINGEKVRGWFEIENRKYYFNLDSGALETGWLLIDEERYYFNPEGVLQTGWLLIDEERYYFDPKGVLQTGWLNDQGEWYFLDESGMMVTGWVKDEGKWYYLNNNGVMQVGWVEVEGEWYYLTQSGSMVTGWLLDKGNWYFLHSNGAMQTGWLLNKGKWYFLKSSGAMQIGWIYDEGKWYFSNSSGAMETGWIKENGKWYYLKNNGAMETGWLYLQNKWYFLTKSGKMATGWFMDNSKWYYAYTSGVMAKNTTIDGYYVGYSGQWIKKTTTPYYIDGVLLVNKNHGLPSTFGGGENPTARAAFNKMKREAANQGVTLHIASGYRSYTYQSNLYWRYVNSYGQAEANRFSAYPGYSEHQTGLAFDIGGSNSSLWANSGFNQTSEAKWLAQNAHLYGFILRYPPGKEHITGYMYESWHFRYLGVDLAKKVYVSGLTLEEYLGEY